MEGKTIRWRAEHEKTGHEYRTPVTAEALEALEEARRQNPGIGDAPLLPAPRDPSRSVSRSRTRTWWTKAQTLAGLEPKRGRGWHSLRRKFASDLMNQPLNHPMSPPGLEPGAYCLGGEPRGTRIKARNRISLTGTARSAVLAVGACRGQSGCKSGKTGSNGGNSVGRTVCLQASSAHRYGQARWFWGRDCASDQGPQRREAIVARWSAARRAQRFPRWARLFRGRYHLAEGRAACRASGAPRYCPTARSIEPSASFGLDSSAGCDRSGRAAPTTWGRALLYSPSDDPTDSDDE